MTMLHSSLPEYQIVFFLHLPALCSMAKSQVHIIILIILLVTSFYLGLLAYSMLQAAKCTGVEVTYENTTD